MTSTSVPFAGVLLASLLGCATQTPKQPAEPPRPVTQSAAAKGQAGMREQVEALLSGYERVPTEEDWKRVGPEALPVLEQIYNDPAMLPSRRTRAVASLAQVDNPEAETKLKGLIADARVDEQYRSTAVLALGHRMGEKALPQLEPLLEDGSAPVRDAAARALGKVGSATARKSLEERLSKEQDATVREAIQQSLTKMEP